MAASSLVVVANSARSLDSGGDGDEDEDDRRPQPRRVEAGVANPR
jgi:hypothetical protein